MPSRFRKGSRVAAWSRPWRLPLALGVVSLVASACPTPTDKDGDNLPPNETSPSTSTTTGHNGSGSTKTNSSTNSQSGDETDTTTTERPRSCEDIICRGHGGCELVGGIPTCICDEAYVLDEAGEECIVDESCIRVRYLEDHCRQEVGGIPAVTLFFGIDFCAGTAVVPKKLKALEESKGLAIQVLENEVDILKNPESSHTLLPTAVESYVTIVLDVSKSVTGDESDDTPPSVDLDKLVGEIRDMVASLKPGKGEAPVAVSMWVFARGFAEYVPFTNDFAKLDDKISAIKEGQDFLPTGVGIYGSDLYKATLAALKSTERTRNLRANVSKKGVLTTGTVVVITDGNDESGATFNELQMLLDSTLNQVISIGISERADDVILDQIGRDGSFLAPTTKDWETAFAEITERVDKYPDRTYFLGYCSSKTSGQQDVTVTLAAMEGIPIEVTGASCRYNADEFSSDGSVSCNAEFLAKECDDIECGGLTACGACADDECCAQDVCMGPSSITTCDKQNDLCHPTGEICDIIDAEARPPLYGCTKMPDIGDPCYTHCTLGVSYCLKAEDATETDLGMCVAVLPLGDVGACTEGDQCETLNCTQKNPDSETDPFQCLPSARLYDFCGPDGSAVCENGGYCQGGACLPRKDIRESCSQGYECEYGFCAEVNSRRICIEGPSCFFSWDEKIDLK